MLEEIAKAVVNLEEEKVIALINTAISKGLSPRDIIKFALTSGIKELGEMYSQGVVFIPHLILGGEILQRSLAILEPLMTDKEKKYAYSGKVAIGTVAGDLHDLGKNLVVTMLKSAGFEVIDLGRDVSTEQFLKIVKEEKPQLLCLSALMTTTMVRQREVIKALEKEGLRSCVKVLVGGAPVSRDWARKIGADGYGEDAFVAVTLAEKLIAPSPC